MEKIKIEIENPLYDKNFIQRLKEELEELDLCEAIKDSVYWSVRQSLRESINVEIGEQLKEFIKPYARNKIIPLVKKEMEKGKKDYIVNEIVESLIKEVVEMAKEIEKKHIRLKSYTIT